MARSQIRSQTVRETGDRSNIADRESKLSASQSWRFQTRRTTGKIRLEGAKLRPAHDGPKVRAHSGLGSRSAVTPAKASGAHLHLPANGVKGAGNGGQVKYRGSGNSSRKQYKSFRLGGAVAGALENETPIDTTLETQW